MRETRVLLADDHRSFAEALGLRLDAEPGLRVVGVVVDPAAALSIVRGRPVDVAVLAVESMHCTFLGLADELLATRPGLKLVGVTGADDPAVLVRAVRVGFRGWVPKDVGIGSLLEVIHGVVRGETCIPPLLLTSLLHDLLTEEEEARAAERPLSSLTGREREVLRAMSSGANRTEIAELLAISPNTVRTHAQSILTKLEVHTSLAAVMIARRAGLL